MATRLMLTYTSRSDSTARRLSLHLLALVGLAEEDEGVGILRVMLQEQSVGGEGVEDAVTEGVAQLVRRSCAGARPGRTIKTTSSTPACGSQVEDRLDDPLAVVGLLHRGQRQGDVVERDGQLHARPQQLGQRLGVADGVQQGLADGRVRIAEGGQGLGGVDDAAPGGQLLQA